MTREEAKAILEVSKHMATSGRMYNQAIDMAIEALHREEAEAKGYCHRIKPKELQSRPNGDLISRADAIKAFNGANLYQYALPDKVAAEILESLPSAEQVISKLNNPCDSLLTDDSAECKEQKSKLDIISRADAIGSVIEVSTYLDLPKAYCERFIDGIKALPSAEAEQGEWIMHIDDLFPEESTQECSNCHEHETIKIRNDNFCPNCGAKMDKGGKEECV